MTKVIIKRSVKVMTISDDGMKFIQEKEAGKFNIKHYNPATEEFEAYLNSANIPTIGYGHTKDVKLGDKMSKQQAEQLFKEEIQTHFQGIHKHITADITQSQYDALASLTYNAGPNFLQGKKLTQNINTGNDVDAAKEFLDINKITNSQGQKEYNRGLQMRRYEESVRFLGDHNQNDPQIKQFVNETNQKIDQLRKEIQNDNKKEKSKEQSDSEQDENKDIIYGSGDPLLIEFYEEEQKRQSKIKKASQMLGQFASMGPGMIF